MRKILLSSVITLAMGAASFAGHAAESATLALTGTITPAACDVSLSSASIDFGKIPASTLTEAMNQILSSAVNVSVACDAPTAVAVQTVDNRASSAMTMSEITSTMGVTLSSSEKQIFGLGNDSAGEKVGAMMLVINSATLDSTANNNVLSSSDKSTWTAHTVSDTSGYALEKDGYFASGNTSTSTTPAAVTNATYALKGGLLLKKADQYPSGEEVSIDGNVTFSVVYL